MRICVLDGGEIENREMLHKILKECLDLPDWYGENLDALHDCLTDLTEDIKIVIQNRAFLEYSLGNYAVSLERMLNYVSRENPHVHIDREEV